MPTYMTRRLGIGVVIGLAMAGLFLTLIISSGSSGGAVTLAELWEGLGTPITLLLAGAFMGGSYALLFQIKAGDYIENMMSGMALAAITWVLLGLTIFPTLSSGAPQLDAASAGQLFPLLVAYLLMGSLIGLLYGLAYEQFAEQLNLHEPALPTEAPPITTRVVVLGGGYAGVAAAQAIEKELEEHPEVHVTIVSENNYLIHTPMLSEVTSSAVSAQNIVPTLRSFFKHVQVVQGEVERVDMNKQEVSLKPDAPPNPSVPSSLGTSLGTSVGGGKGGGDKVLPFDHLVVTLGGVPNFFGNQGVAREAFTFKALEDAILLRDHIINMFERADLESNVAKRRQMLTFVVAGGGFAGVELLGGMNDFARGILSFYPNIPPEDVRLILVHSRNVILPELSRGLGIFAQEKLQERGVEFLLEHRVVGAKPGGVEIRDKKTNQVDVISSDTFVWTAGNKPSPVLSTLGLSLNRRGQIKVNTKLAAEGATNLWAAGDCAEVPDLTNEGKPAPPTAQHAQREGKVLGYNVAATIKGKPLKEFEFKTLGLLAALGHQLAVAEFFGRYRFSGFLAWLMWRAIYLGKLPTLQKQVRVALDWGLDIFFPADIVQTTNFNRPSAVQRLQERQQMIGQAEEAE